MAQLGRTFEQITVDGDAPTVDEDVQDAFDKWREGLHDTESPGFVKAFRIPLDDHGRASHSASGQIRLGSWPVDLYDFDALCEKIIREFMLPTEQMMGVRLIGTIAGKGGARFTKIVTLQRPNPQNALSGPANKDGLGDIMRTMQESNERMLRMFQEVGAKAPATGSPQEEMMRMMAMAKMMNEPMMAMLTSLMPALAGRPVTAGVGGSMKETLETLMMMDKFLGRTRGGGGDESPAWMKMVTSVSSVAAPLLTMASQRQQAVEPVRRRLQPPATRPITDRPTPPPVSPPVSPTPVPQSAAVAAMDRPSHIAVDPFAPSVDTSAPSTQLPPGDAVMFVEMKKQVDALVQVAEAGADPLEVANLFFEQTMLTLDDSGYEQLANFLEGQNFLSRMSVLNPKVKTHTTFFQPLRDRLVQLIMEQDGDASTGA